MDLIISILVLSGINLLCLYRVSGQNCTGNEPIVDPTVLVAEYGGPANARCRVPYATLNMGWEAPKGSVIKENIQLLDWSVNSTDWSLGDGIQCYTNSDLYGQCLTKLPIIIYKIPERVTFLLNHTGPLVEGRQYSLQCEVQSVAPVQNLTIIWYRGDTELKQSDFTLFTVDGDQSKDVTVTADLNITASREDHSALYSCAARQHLNTAKPIPDTRSNATQLEVYYKPVVLNTTGNITIDEGKKLELSCKADANPSPTYVWRHNNDVVTGKSSDTLTTDSVTAKDKGVYECIIKNSQGEISAVMIVNVEVKGNQTGIIIGVVIVVLIVVGVVILWRLKK